jgi:hypothetical protein
VRSRADLRAALLKAGLWLAFVVALAPPVALPVGVGLDPSYGWGLQGLSEAGSLHGRDVVFPYGPLGRLLLPVAAGEGGEETDGALRAAVLGRLGLHLLFAGLLALRLRGVSPARAACAVALLLIANLLGLYFDSRLLLLLALLLGPALVGGRSSRLPAECLGKEELGGVADADQVGDSELASARDLLGAPASSRLQTKFLKRSRQDAGAPSKLPEPSIGAAALAGALAAVFVLVKLNLGLTAVALVTAAFLIAAVRARRSAQRSQPSDARRRAGLGWALGAGAAAFLGVALLALPLFGGVGGALRWLAGQLDLARGFGGAMSAPGLPGELGAGLLALAIVAALALQAAVRRVPLAGFWAAHLVPVWLAFKYGFVRQDGHVVLFFTYLIGLCAVAVLIDRGGEPGAAKASGWPRSTTDRAGAAPLVAALGILLLGAVPAALARRDQPWPDAFRQASGRAGADHLRQTVDLDGVRARLVRRGRRLLAPVRLPPPLVGPLREAGVGVDVLPWELSYLPGNGLRWRPNPVLQLYNAYTRRLDLWCARHFEDDRRAPGFLLAELSGVDSRHMLWDTPETWRVLVQHYELAWEVPALKPRARDRGELRLLGLRRRPEPPAWVFQEIGVQEARVGEWIAVPAVSGWIFAGLELRPSLRGRLADLAFRPEPVLVEALYDDGAAVRWRLVAATAPGGLLLGPSPRSTAELAGLWRGAVGPRVTRFRLAGPGLSGYRDEVLVTWREGRLAASPGPRPAPGLPAGPIALPPSPAAAPPAGTTPPPR